MDEHAAIEWPAWKWQGSGWWLTAAGTLGAFIGLLWPSVQQASLVTRIGAIGLAALVLPITLLVAGYVARSLMVAMRRAIAYPHLRVAALTAHDELAQTKEMLARVLREQDDLPQFQVDGAFVFAGQIYVVIALGREVLEAGDRIVVVDRADGIFYGNFEAVEVRTDGYRAKSIGNVNALWEGYIRQAHMTQTPAPPGAVALLVAKGTKNV